MNRELEVAREVVTSFWEGKTKKTDSKEALVELYRVRGAKPEELVHDFEAIIAILEKALKEIRGKK